MLTIALAALTLLDSSAPVARRTVASGGASVPSFSRNRPSVPRSTYTTHRGYEDLDERLNELGANLEPFRDL